MVALLPNPELQFVDADGHPLSGGTLETYVPGTTTPKATWLDPAKTALQTNPIVLDAAGRCICWADGAYRCILRDSAGNLVYNQPSNTIVSAAMQPVMSAATIEDAVALLGIDDMISERGSSPRGSRQRRADGTHCCRTTRSVCASTTRWRHALRRTLRWARGSNALPSGGTPGVTGVQGGAASTDGSGFYHLVFPSPFVTACDSVVVTPDSNLFVSQTCAVNFIDRTSCEIRLTEAGSPTPVPSGAFMWLALGH